MQNRESRRGRDYQLQSWSYAEQLLAQLVSRIKMALEINIKKVHYWTDSSIIVYYSPALDQGSTQKVAGFHRSESVKFRS